MGIKKFFLLFFSVFFTATLIFAQENSLSSNIADSNINRLSALGVQSRLVKTPDGNLHTVLQTGRESYNCSGNNLSGLLWFSSSDNGSSWSCVGQLSAVQLYTAAIAVDNSGNLHFVYGSVFSATGRRNSIFYRKGTKSGSLYSLSQERTVLEGSTNIGYSSPTLTVEGNARLWLAVRSIQNSAHQVSVYYAQTLNPEGANDWQRSSSGPLDQPGSDSNAHIGLIFRFGSQLGLVYTEDQGKLIWRYRRDIDNLNTWYPAYEIESAGVSSESLSVAVGGDDQVHLSYLMQQAPRSVYYRHYDQNQWLNRVLIGSLEGNEPSLTAVGASNNNVWVVFGSSADVGSAVAGKNALFYRVGFSPFNSSDSFGEIQPLTESYGKFDYVFVDKNGFSDETADAGSSAINDVVMPETSNQAIYFGKTSPFESISWVLGRNADSGSVVWQYWTGSNWANLSIDNSFNPNFDKPSGWLIFTKPQNWQRTSVNNSASSYFIRAIVQSNLSNSPQGSVFVPQTSLMNLAVLSSIDNNNPVIYSLWTEAGTNFYRAKFIRVSAVGGVDNTPTPALQAPEITSIVPNSEYNNQSVVPITVYGSNFVDGVSVSLTRSGFSDITATDEVVSNNGTVITAYLNLVGSESGVWDVKVENPDGQSDTLLAGFYINQFVQPTPTPTAVVSPTSTPAQPTATPTTVPTATSFVSPTPTPTTLITPTPTGQQQSRTHPFLLVREDMYNDLRDRSNTEPWRSMKQRAINECTQRSFPEPCNGNLNPNEYQTLNTKTFCMRAIMSACSLAYIVDPENKDVYLEKVRTTMPYWEQILAVQSGLDDVIEYNRPQTRNTSNEYYTDATSAYFNTILAVDIMYNDLALRPPADSVVSPAYWDNNPPVYSNALQQAETMLEQEYNHFYGATKPVFGDEYYHMPSRHPPAQEAALIMYKIYKGEFSPSDSDSRALLFGGMVNNGYFDVDGDGDNIEGYLPEISGRINDSGVYTEGSSYAYAGWGLDRDERSHLIDVLEFTGKDVEFGIDFYTNPRFQNFYEWLYGYASTPFGMMTSFGDTYAFRLLTDDGHGGNDWASSSHIGQAAKFGANAGAYAIWKSRNTPQQGRLLNYLFLDPNVAPRTPTSRIFNNGGGFFMQDNADDYSLYGALWNVKQPQVGSTVFHVRKDVNAVYVAAYGSPLLMNGGFCGSSSPSGPDNCLGTTETGDRLRFSGDYLGDRAVANNTAMTDYTPVFSGTGANNDPVRVSQDSITSKFGGGVIEGFVGKNLDYVLASSRNQETGSNALPNAVHNRGFIMVHPEGSANGYFVVYDEFQQLSANTVHLAFHPNAASIQTRQELVEYDMPVLRRAMGDSSVGVSLFFATSPDSVQFFRGIIASAGSIGAAVPQFFYNTYNTSGVNNKRIVTVVFPYSASHNKAVMQRISGSGITGAEIVQSSTRDYVLESAGNSSVNYENATFRANLVYYRVRDNQLVSYLVKSGTSFLRSQVGFESENSATVRFYQNRGDVVSSGGRFVFYYPGITGILVDGVNRTPVSVSNNRLEIDIDSGTHSVEFLTSSGSGGSGQNPIELISISPNSESNDNEVVLFNLTGRNFVNGLSVRLVNGNQQINATDLSVVSSTEITGYFNLLNRPAGTYDVQVVSNGQVRAVLLAGFYISQAVVPSPTTVVSPTLMPTATSPPQPSITPVPTSGTSNLQISEVSAVSGTTIGKFEKFEASFNIQGTTAENFFYPYDNVVPSGVEPEQGISVNVDFTPDDWTTVYTQPAFYYQVFEDPGADSDRFYPTGNYQWRVRFTPQRPGLWRYRIRAQDKNGEVLYSNNNLQFRVTDNNKKGFLKVSSTDSRYFVFDDGSYFPNLGYNLVFASLDWNKPRSSLMQEKLANMSDNGIQYARIFLTAWSIYGTYYSPWKNHDNPATSINESNRSNLSVAVGDVYSPESEVSMIISQSYNRCVVFGWNTYAVPFKYGKNYRIVVRYKESPDRPITGPAQAGRPYGLVVKTGGFLWSASSGYCYQSGVGNVIASTYASNVSDDSSDSSWKILTSDFIPSTSNYNPEDNLYLALENVTEGRVMVDKVSIYEVLPDGRLGQNIMTKGDFDSHTYIDERNAYAFDKMLEQAENYGVYLRLVVNHPDFIFSRMNSDGSFTTTENPTLFYGNGRTETRIRWLQKAWWRYLQARWGYSVSIHSWELMNEGDPNDQRHYVLADEFGKFMHCEVFGQQVNPVTGKCEYDHPNDHMVSTSNFTPNGVSFPQTAFWNNSSYPNVDFADIHRYIPKDSDYVVGVNGAVLRIGQRQDFYDTAAGVLKLSYNIGAKQPYGANKPVIRGESGYTETGTFVPSYDLRQDSQGVWLHNFVWAQINSGGLYDASNWYAEHVIYYQNVDHRDKFKPYFNFINTVPLANGNYQDISAEVSNNKLRVAGQKDLVNQTAHLWVQNTDHTWGNITGLGPNGRVSPNPERGQVIISGFSPNANFNIEWWDPYETDINNQILSVENAVSTAVGNLIITIGDVVSREQTDQSGLTHDIALKILPAEQRTNLSPTPTPNTENSDLAPVIIAFTPNAGRTTDEVLRFAIRGLNFEQGSSVYLRRSQQQVSAYDEQVLNNGRILIGNFNLTESEPGVWDLVVVNSNGLSDSFESAFLIR
ncbi:MAG: hypothetical protein KatS3mg090_0514 [Patescibacteria group bacterium]|nr:MAG: hypothetical protein KatS3mg090_0514 [Patescibacteria group bacterium]